MVGMIFVQLCFHKNLVKTIFVTSFPYDMVFRNKVWIFISYFKKAHMWNTRHQEGYFDILIVEPLTKIGL